MAAIKCVGITSFCVAGFVGIPDEAGIVDVPAEVLASDEWARLSLECPEGSFAPATESETDEDKESQDLRAKLKAAGVSFGPRTKIEKLRELVAGIKA